MTKKTIENCSLVKKAINVGNGGPEIQDGKCMGYSSNDDEPCENCKNCSLNTMYENYAT